MSTNESALLSLPKHNLINSRAQCVTPDLSGTINSFYKFEKRTKRVSFLEKASADKIPRTLEIANELAPKTAETFKTCT